MASKAEVSGTGERLYVCPTLALWFVLNLQGCIILVAFIALGNVIKGRVAMVDFEVTRFMRGWGILVSMTGITRTGSHSAVMAFHTLTHGYPVGVKQLFTLYSRHYTTFAVCACCFSNNAVGNGLMTFGTRNSLL